MRDRSQPAVEALDLGDMQGLIVRGYGPLPFAEFLLLSVGDGSRGRAALARWANQVTSADQRPRDAACNIALTADGLRALEHGGLLETFAEPFQSGMVTPYRSRLLGDLGQNSPTGWAWGGPSTAPVHVLVLLYAASAVRLARLTDELLQDCSTFDVDVVARLSTTELTGREPFGFRDGISQPRIAGLRPSDEPPAAVRAGEFALGYVNEYGQRSDRPTLPASADPSRILRRDVEDPTRVDLGRNGSYLVMRQLGQDVHGFWRYVSSVAEAEGSGAQRREHFAAKIVGRWPSGAPLTLAPEHDDESLSSSNDFGYHAHDEHGYGCPIGAHVRRVNPRDALEPRPGTAASLAVNARHRLLRRGRSYGDAGAAERGLHFICLNSSLSRQYEFVQHSWALDPRFNGLFDAEDPLIGSRVDGPTTFTEQSLPARRLHRGLPQFVSVRGGSYFFLPGMRALHFLSRP